VQPMTRKRRRDISEDENTMDQHWGGARLRMMLQCVYTIAFLCLLRFDEVLRIELKDIEVIDKNEGHIALTLPFRKTHQYGGEIQRTLENNESRDQTLSFVLQPKGTAFGSHSQPASMASCCTLQHWPPFQEN